VAEVCPRGVADVCRARNVSCPKCVVAEGSHDSAQIGQLPVLSRGSLRSHCALIRLNALSLGSLHSHSAHCALTWLTALSLGSLRSHSAHCALTRLDARSLGSVRAHSARCALTRRPPRTPIAPCHAFTRVDVAPSAGLLPCTHGRGTPVCACPGHQTVGCRGTRCRRRTSRQHNRHSGHTDSRAGVAVQSPG